MKFTNILILCAFLSLTGCAANTTVQADTKAVSEVSVVNPIDEIIGKRLVGGDGTVFLVRADGTIGGELNGDEIVGGYTRKANVICSTYTSPNSFAGQEFCSTPVIKKGIVVFNRCDGSKSQRYTIDE